MRQRAFLVWEKTTISRKNTSRSSRATARPSPCIARHLVGLFGGMVWALACVPGAPLAQVVDDGSDGAIGKADTRTILALLAHNVKNSTDAKVTSLRRSKGAVVCGSVNVKNQDGLYLGERGFVVDLSKGSFGRVPEGPELMNPRAEGFDEKDRIRALYFEMCLD